MDVSSASLVQASYNSLAPKLEGLVEGFYERLFRVAPAVRGLFPNDLSVLRAHFAASLALMARNAGHVTVMREPLRDLGRRHVKYGAKAEHYPVVGECLLATLADAAGEAWTPESADAWKELLGIVANEMMIGASQADTTRPSEKV